MNNLFPLASKQQGYTLVELIVVMSIIGMLIALAVPGLQVAQDQAALLKIRTDLQLIDNVLNSYFLVNRQGAEAPTLAELARTGLLRTNPAPPAKVLGNNLRTKQYEIDPALQRAFLRLNENTRFYADTPL